MICGLANDENQANLIANGLFINNQTTRHDSGNILFFMLGKTPLCQFLYRIGKCYSSKSTCLGDMETVEHFVRLCQFYFHLRNIERIKLSLMTLESAVKAGDQGHWEMLAKFCTESARI